MTQQMHNMYVVQNGQFYTIYTPNGQTVAQIYMGCDQQYLLDAKCMEVICKVLARRWYISAK